MQSPQGNYIFALDLGTSGPKVGVFTALGELIDGEFEPVSLKLPPGGGAEQDPHEWWAAIKSATARLFARLVIPREDIVVMCTTSQWSGTVPVGRDGQPLMNAIIWMDTRGAPHAQRIIGGPFNVGGFDLFKALTWVRLTGGIPGNAGKDPVAHILWLKEHRPEIYQATYKFLEPKDYINLKLTGQFAASYDSITLHWVTDNRDLSKIDYNERLLAMACLERDKLPDLKRAVDILGPIRPEIAAELGLPETVQVVMGTPDLQSAALGSGAAADFEPHLYLGTSSWIASHVPFKKTDIFHAMGSVPSANPDRYLLINEQETAGACYSFLRDNVFFPQDELASQDYPPEVYKIFDSIAENAPPGSDGLIFTPWLYGERTPVDDPYARGGFFNLSLQMTRAHLLRSVLEGVAFNIRWLFDFVQKFLGQPIESVNMIGGGANSDLWCQIHADILGCSVRQVADPLQANSRGAALLASAAMGYQNFDDFSQRVQVLHTYHPRTKHRPVYDELYKEFLGIYQRNRKAYIRLNKNRTGH